MIFNKRDWLLENSKYYCDVAKASPEKTNQCLGFFDIEESFRKLEVVAKASPEKIDQYYLEFFGVEGSFRKLNID